MVRFTGLMAGAVLGYAAIAPEPALGQSGVELAQSFRADLRGFNEVPSVSTSGTGRFDAELIPEDGSIEYTLQYSGLESVVTEAHIHFSQAATNGDIIVFLCTNLDDGPAGTQACPEGDGEISGVITADDVLGSTDQGLAPGAFDRLLQAMFDRATYANVHTEVHGAGEIRGQITPNTSKVEAR
jgi:CHRD domain